MRIRKRKVPLPLSLLSPIPLSDPHLFSRSPVMLVQGNSTGAPNHEQHTSFCSQPSDNLTLTSASDLHRLIVSYHETTGAVDEGVLQTSNHDITSKVSITTSTTGGAARNYNDNNNNNNAGLGRWCDGDKEIPLKKRRANFNQSAEDTITSTPPPAMTKVVVTKSAVNDDEDGVENRTMRANNNEKPTGEAVVTKKGNNKRGNTIMEGSRCSRVNGRGWRCCQPTLVGYSLCEHHLGKGRLRSITSGSSSSSSSSSTINARMAKKKNNSSHGSGFALGRRDEVIDNDDDDKKLETNKSSFVNNKRVKLGVVKARSLSSLLGQTNTMSYGEDHATMEKHHQDNLDHE